VDFAGDLRIHSLALAGPIQGLFNPYSQLLCRAFTTASFSIAGGNDTVETNETENLMLRRGSAFYDPLYRSADIDLGEARFLYTSGMVLHTGFYATPAKIVFQVAAA
jgi:hypothetical protein